MTKQIDTPELSQPTAPGMHYTACCTLADCTHETNHEEQKIKNAKRRKTNATHYIECFENVGKKEKRRVFEECIFIEMAKNKKAKVKVLKGLRGGDGNIRYVDKDRLIDMYVKT
ncbi:MAG: hypothetical protein WC389_15615 [Lutibacter sp.]|jgi:hypothetical protein